MISITYIEDFDKPEYTAKELAAWYNANRGEMDASMPINGYRTKSQTIMSCKTLMKAIDAQIDFEDETEGMDNDAMVAYMFGDSSNSSEESEKEEVKPERRASNSDGISSSWKDESVKKARTTRNKVAVTWNGGSSVFKSAGSAFAALGLPDSKCIRFRLKLKASGAETFEHAGEKYHFTIVTEA